MPKILIVDDEPENVELLCRRLSRRSFAVVGANSAETALRLAIEEKPDLILMDVKMPVVDGFEATRRLKAEDATRTIPVIVLTAHAMQEDRERAMAAGADAYESKPVDLERLLGVIAQLIPGPNRTER